MALADGYLDRWLRPDTEHYFRGGLPPAFELAHAARLENWRVVLTCELYWQRPVLGRRHVARRRRHGASETRRRKADQDRDVGVARSPREMGQDDGNIIWRLGVRWAPPSGADE